MNVIGPRSSETRTDLRSRPHGDDLAFGATGDAVRRLQQALTQKGFATAVDGIFGPDTLRQLKAFQRAAGLDATGRVDAATRQELTEPLPASTTTTTRAPADARTVADARRRAMTNPALRLNGWLPAPSLDDVRAGAKVKQGMAGPAVEALQRRLRQDGHDIEVDGRFGEQTARALRAWQASRDITDTGALGPTTLKAMDENRPARRTSGSDNSSGGVTRGRGAVDVGTTAGMSEAEKYDHYARLAAEGGGRVRTGANQRNLLGLRVPTDADANGGSGRYDDKIVMFWKDAQGNKHVKEYRANTEPSARYRGRMGEDANSDGKLDQGRLPSGYYEFTTGYSNRLGRTLNPVRDYKVDRDTNQNGVFGDDGGRQTGGGSSMLFHAGGATITGSAGCQTMPPDEFARFWRDLHAAGAPGTIGYTLVEVR